ncbi:YpdA family putative bacillithiol disulfide reductase [Solitalea canadensis]|uniref:Putative bacillithiol system thiol disulfide oxidoreductase, YpdA family n=1 Tax=Solitalea canadensis (strain ATCC 29591 / DSM 3403 / JCM 21819 / LMG 8368 / NBRC 15130 / NCIMB 12057 / USAM 9D) TaxID=929556 RepID=H8KKX5_SOLCM|nr:YpdA family putative bacillithiol disulfide reductase [Solitalea canadensis]AFD08792.1 putative bacillithiol system thiol disulfide oxidoreductase, YpdA family [Solitalea canadensis DSM 3403]
METQPEKYDVIIIGGGPIGIACGLAAKKSGLNYLILEKGCLTNSLYNYPLNMTFFSTSEKLEIGGIPFVSNSAKPNRAEALEYYRRVVFSNELPIHLFEEAKKVASFDEGYKVTTNKKSYLSTHLIIATGFYDIPVMMDVVGEELPKVTHYYKDPHFYAGQKVLVIGANNSAADAALETWRKGAEVTLVIRGPELGRIKYWTKPDLENRINEGSIKALFNSTVKEIREKEVAILTPEGAKIIENDFVIAMTGYQPNFPFLKSIGINLSDDEKLYPAYDKETMETNLKNVYLAGVVCGGMDTHIWFIENSREHADRIIEKIKGVPV